MQNTIKQAKEHSQCGRTRRTGPGQWALDYCTGAQVEFWGPGVLPPRGFFIVPYPALPSVGESAPF